MLYAVGMFVPDPFVFLRLNGENIVILNDLEIDRAKKNITNCTILSSSEYSQKLGKKLNRRGPEEIIKMVLRERKIKKLSVPYQFPFGLAKQLKAAGFKLKPTQGPVFPEREIKNADEVKKISAALMMAEVGLAEGIQALKRSRIARNGKLMLNQLPLTSEKLRSIIDTAILQAGGLPANTIVAGGTQSCDPHERGHGPLKAHQPIILDVFPRSQKTGYFGDITRTVVRGKASERLQKMYHTVQEGQAIAFREMGNGVSGKVPHAKVLEWFEKQGFPTGQKKGRMQGFFHGTGHGLGLEIHEAPRVSPASPNTLLTGHVVTVEPGLYYPDIGGVRLEDVAYVSENGTRNLTKFEKVLLV
ncbi:MAG: Peptidase [Verrucomicrobiales bacterium]|nr:Peptidase [Verrucomicrobiales bacterium]